MSRHLLCVLLLATGVALADNRPKAEAQAKTEAARRQTEKAQAKTQAARGQTEKAQVKTEAAQGQAEKAQVKTEAAQGQTEKAQAKTEAARGQTEKAQAKTEAAGGQTAEAQAKTEVAQERTAEAQAPTEAAEGQTEEAQAQTKEDAKLTSVPGGPALGMSILGNQEAPKALVIVPWKSSELARSPGFSPTLDDSRQPVDKEVFMRALRYYEIRSETARPAGAPTERNAAATAAHRRKP